MFCGCAMATTFVPEPSLLRCKDENIGAFETCHRSLCVVISDACVSYGAPATAAQSSECRVPEVFMVTSARGPLSPRISAWEVQVSSMVECLPVWAARRTSLDAICRTLRCPAVPALPSPGASHGAVLQLRVICVAVNQRWLYLEI